MTVRGGKYDKRKGQECDDKRRLGYVRSNESKRELNLVLHFLQDLIKDSLTKLCI